MQERQQNKLSLPSHDGATRGRDSECSNTTYVVNMDVGCEAEFDI